MTEQRLDKIVRKNVSFSICMDTTVPLLLEDKYCVSNLKQHLVINFHMLILLLHRRKIAIGLRGHPCTNNFKTTFMTCDSQIKIIISVIRQRALQFVCLTGKDIVAVDRQL